MSKSIYNAKLIFWDFDGVIKESLPVKGDVFRSIFLPFGRNTANRVYAHHIHNGGVSRFEKLRLYLEWAGEPNTESKVIEYANRFSQTVLTRVVASPWVPGVEEYLQKNHANQKFVLLTATPENEIKKILKDLKILYFFSDIFGFPIKKEDAIAKVISRYQLKASQTLIIGDSRTDLNAALKTNVPFLLRKHSENIASFRDYTGESIEDFEGI